jgi:thymidylate synthase
MARLIEAADNLSAWRAATQYLLDSGGQASNLVLAIEDPIERTRDWFTRFDPRQEGSRYDRIRDVANTIFPERTYRNAQTRSDLYARYARAHARRRGHFPGSWGTYFGRLTCFGASKGNQLERAIEAMHRWTRNHKAAIVLHISSSETDGIRTRGGPCLQYIQVLCPSRTRVDMLAVYRSHDYFNKTLGNLVGLGRLQQFIALETGRRVGRLSCHSTHAFLGAPFKTTCALLAR